MTKITNPDNMNESEKAQKVDSLRDMINSAEKTIQSAKAMLLQLEGKKKAGRRKKAEDADGGKIVQGTFDGQSMIGTDGKQYPVPANYASKSKLVEGDMLKLTIPIDGSFLYKQIGPIDRKHLIGTVSQDAKGNYVVTAEGKPYNVLLASITYFKVEPGDEVAILVPNDMESNWAAIENVLRKSEKQEPIRILEENIFTDEQFEEKKEQPTATETQEKQDEKHYTPESDVEDEWAADIEQLEKEIKAQDGL